MGRAPLAFLLAACGTTGSVPLGPPPPGPDASADAGCAAVDGGAAHASEWAWTRSLHTPSLLRDMKRHASGDVILAGSLSAALDNYDIHIAAPQGSDPFLFRVDAHSGKLVWATTFPTTTSDATTNHGVANAIAIDGDDVFVAGTAFGTSIAFGASVVTFPPPASGDTPARSFVAKLSAIDGSVIWGVSFDANRTPYDANVETECITITASGGEIDVGCEYIGAQLGLGAFSIKTAPPPALALAMIHLVDGSSPTISRAKAYQSESGMLVMDETRAPNGDVYFASTPGKTITDLDEGTTVVSNASSNGVVAKLSPSGSLALVASPITLVVHSKLRYLDDALILTGVGVAKLDTSLNVAWHMEGSFGGPFNVPVTAPFGCYVSRAARWDPPSITAIDSCGAELRSYTPITMAGASPPQVTIDGLVLEDEGDLILAGTNGDSLTFDDGTQMVTGYLGKSDWPWDDIYFARRASF